MAATSSYDAVVIGSGQGGGPLTTALARAGRRTALVEREHVGGTCINEGCTPTKSMVASARVAHLARRAADYGVQTGPLTIDMVTVRQRKRDIVASFRAGSERRITRTEGVALLPGEAHFVDPHTLELAPSGDRLTAEWIFLNVGARPSQPPIPGLASVPTLDSTSVMELDEVPAHLLVLGGGYVGLEFGQMFRRFGSEVTIVQRGPRLLAREDPDVADAVAALLREDGIEVVLSAEVTEVQTGPRLSLRTADGPRTIDGSHLLVAAGRVPNTERLQLAAAGVATNAAGFIPTNDRLETNVPHIYALGDVKGGPAFTHISYDDYRIVKTNLLDGGNATTADRYVPYTVYIDPQLGRVGLTETEARARGLAYQLARMDMTSVARALETDESRGFMKVLVEPGTSQILGAAILGIEGGELMSMLEIAMLGKLPYTTLRDATFAHPALSESFNNLFARLKQPA